MNKGKQNEYDFVLMLNGKKVKELDPNSYDMIHAIFNNISDNSIIKSWKNHYKQKTDVMIKIDNIIKGISIKMGSKNSVHVEPLSSFIKFLENNGIPHNIIDMYLKYHFADGTNDGTGKNRMSAEEYKCNNKDDIELINNFFNKEKIIDKSIDRFILFGNNSKYSIDAICLGEANDYLWITRDDIVRVLKDRKLKKSIGVHFSNLFCQPQTRNLNYNSLYEKKRYCVQIKWYSLFDDIILNMYLKSLTHQCC